MSQVQAVAGTGAVGAPLYEEHARGSFGAPPLLPAPSFVGFGDIEEGLGILYALQNDRMDALARDANVAVRSNRESSEAQLKAVKEARLRQEKAEASTRGFWGGLKKLAGTIGKIASVVAGVATIACSGGAALPLIAGIAAVALSAGGTAVRELKLFGEDSDKIASFMEMGAAVVSVGTFGAAALGVSAAAANGGSAAMEAVRFGAAVTDAAATATSAAAGIVIADFQRDADHALADAEEARFAMDRFQRAAKLVIETYEEALEATKEALAATQSAMEACNQAAEIAIAGVRG